MKRFISVCDNNTCTKYKATKTSKEVFIFHYKKSDDIVLYIDGLPKDAIKSGGVDAINILLDRNSF